MARFFDYWLYSYQLESRKTYEYDSATKSPYKNKRSEKRVSQSWLSRTSLSYMHMYARP